MEDDCVQKERGRKREFEGGGGEGEEEEKGSNKRHKQKEEDLCSPLEKLPVELLYSIHLYAKNPAFTMLNRHYHSIFKSCPVSIKSEYLIARWHEAYCYGFYQPDNSSKAKGKMTTTNLQSNDVSILPSSPSRDLLNGGSIPELSWSSRFLPIIPVADWPHPLSNSFQRSADHYILDYCLTYPLCDYEVLRSIEDLVLSSSEFGNIILATGLWSDERGGGFELCSYQDFYEREGKREAEYVKPSHLMVKELPKRIFRNFSLVNYANENGKTTNGNGSMNGQRASSSSISSLDPELSRHLHVFGAGPVPPAHSLLLFLTIISLHVAYSHDSISTTNNPVNSFEGLPLAKSVFTRSPFMVQILLFLGAEPSQKGSLALYIAIRSGWLDGLQMMVERDDVKNALRKKALQGIRRWIQRDDQRRNGLSDMTTLDHGEGNNDQDKVEQLSDDTTKPKKRRKLADRTHMSTNMLKEAVKHNQWAVANWIRSKGVSPDLRTIKLIELKQDSGSI